MGTGSSAEGYPYLEVRGIVVIAVIEAGLALGCMNT